MAKSSMYPPSVKPGIPRLGRKPEGWIDTSIGDVLVPEIRPATIDDDEEYQLLTAKRSRGGIVPRERLLGKAIKTKTQYYVKTDDFVISKRQIVHGACGIVPSNLEGAIVSGEYAVMKPEPGQLLLDYLALFTHTLYFQQTCFQASVGVDIEKMLFRLDEWFDYRIFLPPLPEQRKIARILSTWDEAIATVEALIASLHRRKKGLLQRLLSGQTRLAKFSAVPLAARTVQTGVPFDWAAQCFGDFARRYNRKFDPSQANSTRRCVELEHISQNTGELLGWTDSSTQTSTKNCFKAGQVLFGKLRPYLRKYAKPEFDGVCSSEIWVLEGTEGRCLNDYLYYLVQTDRSIAIANVTSGTKMPRSDWGYVSEG